MSFLELVLVILATACIHVQAQNNLSACNQSTNHNQSDCVESFTLVKELESEAVDELMSATSTFMTLVKSEQARMAKVKAAMAGVKADLTSEMTIKAIVRELKAQQTNHHTMAMSELKAMLNTQKKVIEELVYDMKALRKSLSARLENSERKIEWAITDGSLAPRNTSWVMENFSQIKERLYYLDAQNNGTREMLQKIHLSTSKPQACAAIFDAGLKSSGVYTVHPSEGPGKRVYYCDMETDGGGWTVIQKRYNGQVDFFRGWEDYAQGFGDPEGEHWLGLRYIHNLTQTQHTQLYVGLDIFEDGLKYAKYGRFMVSSEEEKFRLYVGSYTGDAGDGLSCCNGAKFSTKDQDNDEINYIDHSDGYHGAWWYDRSWSDSSNLNGRYSATQTQDRTYMFWDDVGTRHYVKSSLMMIRPANFNP